MSWKKPLAQLQISGQIRCRSCPSRKQEKWHRFGHRHQELHHGDLARPEAQSGKRMWPTQGLKMRWATFMVGRTTLPMQRCAWKSHCWCRSWTCSMMLHFSHSLQTVWMEKLTNRHCHHHISHQCSQRQQGHVKFPTLEGASGSGGADHVPAVPERNTQREAPTVRVELLGKGRITWYRKSGNFVALCKCPGHGKCELTRTSRSDLANWKRFGQLMGRPLGLMAAWLHLGPTCGTKAKHWDFDTMNIPLAARQEARAALAVTAQGRALLAMEREKWGGEPDEPFDLTGYI